MVTNGLKCKLIVKNIERFAVSDRRNAGMSVLPDYLLQIFIVDSSLEK